MDPENTAAESVQPPAKPAPRSSRRRAAADTVDQPAVATAAKPSAAPTKPAKVPGPAAEAAMTPAETSTTNAPTAPFATALQTDPLPPTAPAMSMPAGGGASPVSSTPDDHLAQLRPPARRSEYPQQRPGDYRGEPRPAVEAAPPSNIYRARRPAFAAGLIIPAVLIGLLLVRILAVAAFGPTFSPSGIVASSLGLAALPMLVTGLYGLRTGAAYGAEHAGFKLWARPPLAYLVVGIAFVIAAAVAVR